MAQFMLVSAFNTVGVATQHEHWLKEAEDVEPIVGPLCRIIEKLPKSVLIAFEKRFNAIALCVGIAATVGPDVVAEVKIRRAETAAREEEGTARARQSIHSTRQAATRNSGTSQGNGGEPAGSPPDWVSSLPTPDMQVDYE